MALHFSGETTPKTYELITAGQYEVILNAEWKKAQSGNMYINCIFKIREGLGQNFERRVVFDGIYKSKATGEFQEQKINAILSAIPNAKRDFEDYDDLIQYLNDKPMIVEIDVELPDPEKPNSRERNIITYLSYEPSKVGETSEKIFGDTLQKEDEDFDLPF